MRAEMKSFAERNRLAIGTVGIVVVAAVALAALQYQRLPFFNQGTRVSAYFADAGGLRTGNTVEVSGYPVGKVSSISLDGPGVLVEFKVDTDVRLGNRTEVAIKTKGLLGSKFLDVTPRGDGRLDSPIPIERTTSPYQLPDALGDLAATISGLHTERLSESLATLAQTFADTPAHFRNAIHGVARLAQTLDERDNQLRSLLANAAPARHDDAAGGWLVRIGLTLVMIAAVVASCGWRGLNSLPLPGTQGNGPGSFAVQAQLPDVNNIQPNSRVRVADVTVGHVTKIERQGWHALVTMRLDGDVDLPANATAKIGTTSLLGSYHIELAPPKGEARQGKLRDGSLIALSHGSAYPSTEQTLAALSLVLNGGGLGQVQDITEALSTAFAGREHDLRGLIGQLDTFTAYLNNQSGDIIAATDSLNRLVGKFADQQPVFDRALATIPDALAVLADERDTLVEAAEQLSKFSALTVDSVNKTTANLVTELRQLGPVLESLANSGPALTRSLSLLATFPFPNETFQNFQRGEYANLTAIVDLTLSRIDQGLLTGTRWECHLTQLELQWGRTIGQFPSPCTAGYRGTPGNPLTIAYRWDQGP